MRCALWVWQGGGSIVHHESLAKGKSESEIRVVGETGRRSVSMFRGRQDARAYECLTMDDKTMA